MSKSANRLDAIVTALAPVRDQELVSAVRAPAAVVLFGTIVEAPVDSSTGKRVSRRRSRVVAFAVVAAVAAVLSIPAFGVRPEIVSLFAGWRDPGSPVPTASDVVIASGEAGVPWKIVATRSDQGLCLGLFHQAGGDSFGSASCGYADIRGGLPPELRGDPASKCIATPTMLVPCGSLPLHWIGPVGAGEDASLGLNQHFVFGPLAEEVESVDLVLSNGRKLRAHVVEQPEGLPLDFYWAAWPAGGADAGVQMAIARDAAGGVLERRVPAWNGNPTGDPDGPTPPQPLGE
jgi:hypothetical protein